MRRARPLLLALAWLSLGAGEPAPAPAPEPESAPAGDAAPLDLDRLLRVPNVSAPEEPRLGGRSRRAWYDDFARSRTDIADLERRIQEAQEKLRAQASSDWGFTPAGASTPTDPETLKLRADLRRDRQSLETARRRLRDLEVEASLAGVPDDWRTSAE
jgi:hypothetical protein